MLPINLNVSDVSEVTKNVSENVTDMNNEQAINPKALRQRRYRERQKENGSQRFDIYIPADLLAELEPQLRKYGYPYHPAKAIVSLLEDIDFGE